MSQKGSALLFLTVLIAILASTATGLYYLTKRVNLQPSITYLSSATPLAPNKSWKTYTAYHFANRYGPSYKFTVQYPPEWKPEELDIVNAPQIWLNPIVNTSEHKQIHIYIKQNSTLKQWINENSASRTSINQTKTDIKSLGEIDSVTYTGPVGIGVVFGKAFQAGTAVYDFFIVTDGPNAAVYSDLISGIISTFKLNK